MPNLEALEIDLLFQMVLLVKPDEELWMNQLEIVLTDGRTIESECWTVSSGFRFKIKFYLLSLLPVSSVIEEFPYF